MKIDTSCKNKKCLDLDAFLRYHYQVFSFRDKKIPFLDLLTTVNSAIANVIMEEFLIGGESPKKVQSSFTMTWCDLGISNAVLFDILE